VGLLSLLMAAGRSTTFVLGSLTRAAGLLTVAR
jgi:hypothetical protein